MDPPLVKLGQSTIVHLEDQDAYEPPLRYILAGHSMAYHRTSLVSKAGSLIHDQNVVGFIIDLWLPTERESDFREWGSFARTWSGLVKKIRQERPSLPVVIFTLHSEDPDLQTLIREEVITHQDIFTKVDSTDDEAIIESLVARLQTSRLECQLRVLEDMDPNLQYLVAAARRGYRPRATASTREGEVAVLARVKDLKAWQELDGLRPGIAIPDGDGWLVTGRVLLKQVEAVKRQPFVDTLQAAERLRPMDGTAPEETVPRTGLEALSRIDGCGRGVVVGIIDSGCDFAHPRFRQEDGSTRLLEIGRAHV